MLKALTMPLTRHRRVVITTLLLLAPSLIGVACGDWSSPASDGVQPGARGTTPGRTTRAVTTASSDNAATVPPTEAPDVVTTTGLPVAPATTTSTTAAVEAAEETPARIGYRVVGVAADEVLHVRAGASIQDPVIGTLAPDATGLLVTDTRGDRWWRVLLDSGVSGWVNSTYLAVDEAWTAPFEHLPCAAGDVAWGEVQISPRPTPASDAAFVWSYDYLESEECDRLVIRLATRPDDATVSDWQAGRPAASVPDGVRVTSGANRVIVTFPEDFFDIRLGMERVDYGSVELFAVAPIDMPRKRAIELFYPSERIANARFLSDPARIVVDVRPAPDPTGVDYSPRIGGLWVLAEPVLWDGSISTPEQPITVTGLGRPYEAQGFARISRIDGDPGPVAARWSGGFDCIDDLGSPTARGAAYCFNADYRVWGEFSLTIDELPSGRYRLWITDECAGGTESECDAGVFNHEFSIG